MKDIRPASWHFNYSIQISSIEVSEFYINLQGIVTNIGASAWDNKDLHHGEKFYLSLKLLGETSSIKNVWETRYEFVDEIIRPFYPVKFSFQLPLSIVEQGEQNIQLDMLKEGEFWFESLGILPYRDSFELKFPSSGPIKNCITLLIENLEIQGDRFELNVQFKNNSVHETKLTKDYFECLTYDRSGASATLELEIIKQSKQALRPLEVARVSLRGKLPELGHEDSFLKFKCSLFAPSSNCLVQGEEIIFGLSEVENEDPKYVADILIQSNELKQDNILHISGTIQNLGNVTWSFDRRIINRITVGVLVKTSAGNLILESRLEPPDGEVWPNEKFRISGFIELYHLPVGSYEVEVDLVKEREFWFNQFDSQPYKFSIEIKRDNLEFAPLVYKLPFSEFRLTEVSNEILIFAPTLPLFDRESGGNRLFEIIKILAKISTVNFCYESEGCQHFSEASFYKQAMLSAGVKKIAKISEILIQMDQLNPGLILLCWPEMGCKYFDHVRSYYPKAFIIVDSVDLRWVRERRGIESGELDLSKEQYLSRMQLEQKLYLKADQVWVVTNTELDVLMQELHIFRCKVVSNIHVPIDVPRKPKGKVLLFVGNFDHPPNVAAVIRAIEICKILNDDLNVSVTLRIIGKGLPAQVLKLADQKFVEVLGPVPELNEYYSEALALLAPLTYGAGIKGKICHAACAAVPIITTQIGAEGLNFVHGMDALIAESNVEFAQSIVDLVNGNYDSKELGKNAREKVLRVTGIETVSRQIVSICKPKEIVIAIVTFNNLKLLKRCLDSILEKTVYPNFKVAVWSNGCEDGSLDLLNSYQEKYGSKLMIYENKSNDFFVLPNNKIIQDFENSDVVLVNNDVEVCDADWLTNLNMAAYMSPQIGAAGGVLVSESGEVLEYGSEIYNDGYGRNVGRGQSPDQDFFKKPRYSGYISGALLYMKRDVLNTCGILDPDFHPMYYEDSEWQYRIHLKGYRSIVVPNVKAIHREGSSAGVSIESGMKRYQEVNRPKFVKKFSKIDVEVFN